MTTSWAHAVRGDWPRAGRTNAGGAVLAAIALLAAPWLAVSAACGRWWIGSPDERGLAGAALGVVALTLADWMYRLMSG